MITGFPGETDQQFEELVEFVRQQRFERLGVFTYSYEADTPSANLPDHVDDQVKELRRERLMAVQRDISREYNEMQIGRVRRVILDRRVPGQSDVWVGRTESDAPDIDGLVFVTENMGQPLDAGEIVSCEIVASQNYDLVAVAQSRSEPT